MATPDLSLLDEQRKREYETLIRIGMTEEAAFESVFQNQEAERKAQEEQKFRREQNEAFEQKDYSKLDPLVQEALGLIQPDYTKPIAERFLPGFAPTVVPRDDDRAYGATSKSIDIPDLTRPQRLEELKQDAVNELEVYFQKQGYPTFVETQEALTEKFVDTYGDRDTYIANQANINVPRDEAEYKYDKLLEYIQNPPVGMRGAAETQARQFMFGPYEDETSFGPVKGPIQPRRYSQFGDMEKVGPRMDRTMQGASPLAEEFKKDPSIARTMSIGELFDEATRPQVVRTGEEERRRREQQKRKEMEIDGQLRLLKREQGLTYAEGMSLVAEQFKEQALREFRKNPSAFAPSNPTSIKDGVKKYTDSEMQRLTRMRMDTAANQAVIAYFREAGMAEQLFANVPEYSGMMVDKIPDYVTESIKYMTEKGGNENEVVRALQEQGRIDPDAIVEARPMQYLRNLNMVFRAIINPVMDIAFDETGADVLGVLPDQRTGVDEVEFYEKYGGSVAPTYDFTEDADGLMNTFDAYMREVLVETATGRTLGDDIVSYHPDSYYEMMRDKDFLENEAIPGTSLLPADPGTYVLAGTLFEMAIPVEAPIAVAASSIKMGSKVPANIAAYGRVAREINKTPGLEMMSVNKMDQVPGVKDMFAQNAKVSSHISDDAADTVLALERVRDAGKADLTPQDIDILQEGLNPKGRQTVVVMASKAGDSSTEASKIIDDLAGETGRNRPIMQAAAKDSKANISYGTGETAAAPQAASVKVTKPLNAGESIDPVYTLERQKALKSAAMEVAEGQYGLGDYVMLTPRMAVTEKFRKSGKVDEAFDTIEGRIGPMEPGFEPRKINDEFFKLEDNGGKRFLDDPKSGTGINYARTLTARKSKDPKLDGIINDIRNGRPITFEEDSYLRQVLLEQEVEFMVKGQEALATALTGRKSFDMLGVDGTPIRTTPGSTFDELTQVPMTRRSEPGRMILRITPKVVKDNLKKATKPLSDLVYGTPNTPLQDQAIEQVVSLQRQAPLAMGRLARKEVMINNPVDDAFAYGFHGEDFTEVNRIPRDNNPQLKAGTQDRINRMDTELNMLTPDELLKDERVISYYRKMLGTQFDTPAGKKAFEIAMNKVAPGRAKEVFNESFTRELLEEMTNQMPDALKTAAVTSPRTAVKPKHVDVVGTKIAWTTDQAANARMMRVGANMDDYVEAPVKMSNRVVQQLDLTEEQAQALLNIQTARILSGGTLGGEAELLAQYNRIKGFPPDAAFFDPAGKQRGIRAFMNQEFGVPANQKALYIRGAEEELRVARGYKPQIAEAKIKNEVIPTLMGGENRLAMEAFAPETYSEIAKLLDNPGINETIAKNLTLLRRASPNGFRYIFDMFDYVVAPRKRLVAGQLGGLLIPNPIYHAENYLTANLIASMTDPTYIDAVVAQQIRGLGITQAEKGLRGVGIHFDPSIARDVEIGYEGLRRYVTQSSKTADGTATYRIGNYSLDEAIELYRTKNLGSTQTSLQFGDNFVRDVEDMARGYGGAIAQYAKRGTIAPGAGTPYGMKIADSTDRMFREAVFFDALSKGLTGDEAARLAREVLLDYGSMPAAAQSTIGKYFLYMSFTYTTVAETMGALLRPKTYKMADFQSFNQGLRTVFRPDIQRSAIAQANYHRKLSEQMFGDQTELMDAIFFNEMDKAYDKDAKAFFVYLRNPMIGSMSQVANILESFRKPSYLLSKEELEKAAAESQVMPAGFDFLNVGYNPILSLLGDLSMEYKKPVPDKFVYQLTSLPTEGFLNGPWVKDLFDIEYVPMEDRRVGKAEVGVDRKIVDMSTGLPRDATIEELESLNRGGYQMRFKSEAGYQNYVLFQQAMAFAGYQRLVNNITGAMIAAGQLPEGTTFGYSEKGNPVLYYVGRQKPVRVPQEWEKLDRQMRMYERDLQEFMGQFEE